MGVLVGHVVPSSRSIASSAWASSANLAQAIKRLCRPESGSEGCSKRGGEWPLGCDDDPGRTSAASDASFTAVSDASFTAAAKIVVVGERIEMRRMNTNLLAMTLLLLLLLSLLLMSLLSLLLLWLLLLWLLLLLSSPTRERINDSKFCFMVANSSNCSDAYRERVLL